MTTKIPMTPDGHTRLSAELRRLKTEERPAVINSSDLRREASPVPAMSFCNLTSMESFREVSCVSRRSNNQIIYIASRCDYSHSIVDGGLELMS